MSSRGNKSKGKLQPRKRETAEATGSSHLLTDNHHSYHSSDHSGIPSVAAATSEAYSDGNISDRFYNEKRQSNQHKKHHAPARPPYYYPYPAHVHYNPYDPRYAPHTRDPLQNVPPPHASEHDYWHARHHQHQPSAYSTYDNHSQPSPSQYYAAYSMSAENLHVSSKTPPDGGKFFEQVAIEQPHQQLPTPTNQSLLPPQKRAIKRQISNESNSPVRARKKGGFMCLNLPLLRCDMENVFEVIDILILFVFLAFLAMWWLNYGEKQDPTITYLLWPLSILASLCGLVVLGMRQHQSSLRWREMSMAFNDFRFVLFSLGLAIVVSADLTRYWLNDIDSRYLWVAHGAVWVVLAMLWGTIDFATYMGHFVSTSYHVFILCATGLEFGRVCWQVWLPSDVPHTFYSHHGVEYTLYDFKLDGLLLMVLAQVAAIVTLVRNKHREFYCFGLGYIYRHRLLHRQSQRNTPFASTHPSQNNLHRHPPQYGVDNWQPSPPMRSTSVTSSQLFYSLSGNHLHLLHRSDEDSVLLVWIINLSCLAYLSFFVWDFHNPYKSIPAAVSILASIMLTYRECDLQLLSTLSQQSHFWFALLAIVQVWFVMLYCSVDAQMDAADSDMLGREIGSFLIDTAVFTAGMCLLFVTDLLLSSVSSSFILRATVPVIVCCSGLFGAWFISFQSGAVQRINWPISIVARNGTYILSSLACISIIQWLRDPSHKYFIFIQDQRKRKHHRQNAYNEPDYSVLRQHSRTPFTNEQRLSLREPLTPHHQKLINVPK